MPAVTIKDLELGTVARVRLSELAKIANESLPTLYRKIKNNQLTALIDPITERLFIPHSAALDYLRGKRYSHNPQNIDACSAMEKARAAKRMNKNEG
jgi:hypothetical protein